MTDIYVAFSNSGMQGMQEFDWETNPLNVLVSFAYLPAWETISANTAPEKTMLDSGAFSAWNAGHEIDIDALLVEAKKRHEEHEVADLVGFEIGRDEIVERVEVVGGHAARASYRVRFRPRALVVQLVCEL